MSDTAEGVVEVKDGHLILRGIVNPGIEGEGDVPLLTGGITSYGKKNFGYGRIDIRAKIGAAGGAWPALWMMPWNYKEKDKDPDAKDPFWDSLYANGRKFGKYAEFDICEKLNFDDFAYQSIHTTYTLMSQEMGIEDKLQKRFATGTINPDDFNVYSIEHYKDSVKYYINDVNTLTYVKVTEGPDVEQIPARAQWPFDQEFCLILDMQVGGPWPGEPVLEDLPIEMVIDYVRFYEFK